MNVIKTTAVAAAVTLVAGVANAALIDFTNAGAYGNGNLVISPANVITGTAAGGFTAVGTGGSFNISEAGPGAVGPLAGDNDGLGINDDEITNPNQSLTITFNQTVTLTNLYFLDHFAPEVVTVTNGTSESFASTIVYGPGGIGFTSWATSLTGTTFTFTVENANEIGRPDFALAGIQTAPIPLPAGVVLLGGALAGLGLARRRK